MELDTDPITVQRYALEDALDQLAALVQTLDTAGGEIDEQVCSLYLGGSQSEHVAARLYELAEQITTIGGMLSGGAELQSAAVVARMNLAANRLTREREARAADE